MNKLQLIQQILSHLEQELEQAHRAALIAHETATHEENIAENKYDTLGLEAAYLASGQARRVEQIQQHLLTWRQLIARPFNPEQGIALGNLVQLLDEQDHLQWFFLGPPGASIKLSLGQELIQVLSHRAPLGQQLLGKALGDEVCLRLAPREQRFEVLNVS